MTDAIKSATSLSWTLALCRKKKFSEYLLYGNFVANSPKHLARHYLSPMGRGETRGRSHTSFVNLLITSMNGFGLNSPSSGSGRFGCLSLREKVPLIQL